MRPTANFRIRLLCALILFFSLLLRAVESPANSEDWVVVIPVANMYSSASSETDVVSQAVLGSHVTALEIKGDWVQVRTADQYTGWVPAAVLRKENGEGTSHRFVAVDSLFANVYRETDVTLHQPLLTAPFESRLELVAAPEDNSRWLQVRLPDGRPAWIQRSDVVFDQPPLSIDQSIALAKRFLGLPYLWGGRSSFGYDCSGFTQMLVRSRGINMPRDADLQATWNGMELVERKDLRAGDLLFFGASVNKITHTAMYIGDGEFVHATTHGRPVIQISKLDEDPWPRLLVACRRVRMK